MSSRAEGQESELKKELAAALEEFARNPKDQSIQKKLLDLVAQEPDSTMIIGQIMSKCTSKLAESGEDGEFIAMSLTVGGAEKEMPIRYLTELPDVMSEVHSEHLYFAAKCIGRSQKIAPGVLKEVIRRLLFEFDLEIGPPLAAIRAFGEIGEVALPFLMAYIKDIHRETFSREDAALALGAIGTDLVVSTLGGWLDDALYSDKAMPLYALGKTKNPKARPVIVGFLQKFPEHPKAWVANNALAEIG